MTEAAATPKKKMGRPPKAPEKGRRQNYTFRMSDADRDRVIEAAAKSGRSMSEEIEWRITASLVNERRDAVDAAILGSRIIANIAKDLALALRLIDPPTPFPPSGSYELERLAFLGAAKVIAKEHLPDRLPLMAAVTRTEQWERACLEAKRSGPEIGGQVLQQSHSAFFKRLAAEAAARPVPEEPDLSSFTGMGGLMGAGAEEQAQRRATEAEVLHESGQDGGNFENSTENIRISRENGGKT
ncbi:hypothetical protein [Methylobacterium planeticum]|uniref:Uncharacterized protein n=1 Tax=Methylobacterium planeticum TaxID=2615211 RepID=A0A6N6MTY8_9HYPH|nr:hypothetical protein [Methylobacterium planeticum]KAB1072177.1 hypothetical protein F6X51_17295 [Methylobacterium planeticum]